MEKWLFMQLFKVDLVNFLTSKDGSLLYHITICCGKTLTLARNSYVE